MLQGYVGVPFFCCCESIDVVDYLLKSQHDKVELNLIELVSIIKAIPVMLAQDRGKNKVVKQFLCESCKQQCNKYRLCSRFVCFKVPSRLA